MHQRQNADRTRTRTSRTGRRAPPKSGETQRGAREERHLRVRVVAAVQCGLLGMHDALQRYGLSLEEFLGWEQEAAAELLRRRETGRLRELTQFRRRRRSH